MLSDVVSRDIHDLAGHWGVLDELMRLSAQDLIYLVGLVLLALWLYPDGLRGGVAAGVGAVSAVGVGALVAVFWLEPRPFVADHFTPLIAHAADGSFPSDHLLALGAVTGGMWFAARRLALICLTVAVMVAFARVFVGVHYVLDVGAGFAIGFVCGALAWHALEPATPLLGHLDTWLRTRHLRPNPEVLDGADYGASTEREETRS